MEENKKWITEKRAQLFYLEKLQPQNPSELKKALENICALVSQSIHGWTHWLSNWPIMEKFHTKDLVDFSQSFQSFAIQVVKIEIEIAIKLKQARLELLEGFKPTTRPGYADTIKAMCSEMGATVNMLREHFSALSNQTLSTVSEGDLNEIFERFKKLAQEVLRDDIKATKLGSQRFQQYVEEEQGIPNYLASPPEESPRDIYI